MKRNYHKRLNFKFFVTQKRAVLFGGVILLGAAFLCIPPPRFDRPFSTVITASDGSLLGAHVANDGQWHFRPTVALPQKYTQALITFEDEYFYFHPGVNPWSLLRATIQNIRAGHIESGGSTIDMQVARMATGAPRTLPHKLYEMLLALRLEVSSSKEEILELYAANAPFGGNIVGLETASWRYFGRPPQYLTWAESALLAVLPNAPGLLHPGKNPIGLKHKRDRLLQKLEQKGKMTPLDLEMALSEPLPAGPGPLPGVAPHLLDHFLKIRPGSSSQTTLDATLQSQTNQVVQRHSNRLSANHINHAAALIASIETGEVLAYVGNSAPQATKAGHAIDMIRAPRSSGSILKPFLYAAALQDGLILPASLLADVPTRYHNYAPQNFNRRYDGAVPANEALSRSLNIPFVRLLQSYGGERFLELLQKTGFTSFPNYYQHYGLSLILGGGEVSLMELAGNYAALARVLNHYTRQKSQYFKRDFRPLNILPQPEEAEEGTSHPPVYSAGSIWSTFEALSGVVRPPEETGWEHFTSSRRIAWKTGTSFGFKDAWSVGFSRDYVVAVWVGNASGEGRPGLLGGTSAGPLMFELFDLLPRFPWFESPLDDMEKVQICTPSGYRAGPNCPHPESRLIPHTIKPSGVCPFHRLVHLTPDRQFQTRMECEPSGNLLTCPWFVLPPLMEWYYRQRNPHYLPLPPAKPGCLEQTDIPMDFIYPGNPYTTILVPVDLNGKRQRVVFSAVHRDTQATLFWHLDDRYLGQTSGPHEMEVLPSSGTHLLTIVDNKGNRLTRNFKVPDFTPGKSQDPSP